MSSASLLLVPLTRTRGLRRSLLSKGNRLYLKPMYRVWAHAFAVVETPSSLERQSPADCPLTVRLLPLGSVVSRVPLESRLSRVVLTAFRVSPQPGRVATRRWVTSRQNLFSPTFRSIDVQTCFGLLFQCNCDYIIPISNHQRLSIAATNPVREMRSERLRRH